MNRLGNTLIAAGCVAMSAYGAAAADLKPVVKARPAVVPVPVAYNWTGFYVGANAGRIHGRSSFDAYNGFLFPPVLINQVPLLLLFSTATTLPATSGKDTSWLAGGQVGYNWQINQFLMGVEADAVASRLRMTGITSTTRSPGTASSTTITGAFATDIDWMASFRARLGVTFDRVLLYVTGGGAVAAIDINTLMTFANGPLILVPAGGPFTSTSSTSTTRFAWTVGAGIEWAFDHNWSLAGEYRHSDFGRAGTSFTIPDGLGGVFTTGTTSARVTTDQATLRLNYRFGAAPVVARY